MSRRAPVWVRSLVPCLAAIAFLAVAPPSHAGLGDMMKKAKDKALKTADKKVEADAQKDPCKGPEFDAVTLELTNQRVESILVTFKAAGEAGAGRPALVEKLNRLLDERNTLDEKYGEGIRETGRKRDEVASCYHDGYRAAAERRGEEYKARALTDPKLLEKYQKAAAQYNAAAAKGDSNAINKLNEVLLSEIQPTPEDSAQVRKECGTLPPKSAQELKMEELDKQIRELNDQIAKIDEKVAKVQAKQGGMDPQQWAIALERIQAYLGAKSGSTKSKICGFTEAEVAVLDKHYEQLKATLG
jgi:chaperonin cofactor prefoldin